MLRRIKMEANLNTMRPYGKQSPLYHPATLFYGLFWAVEWKIMIGKIMKLKVYHETESEAI